MALPTEDEETAPGFAYHPTSALPTFEEADSFSRLIAGSAFWRHRTRSDALAIVLPARRSSSLRADAPTQKSYPERPTCVIHGRVEISGQAYTRDQLLVFAPEATPVNTALEPSTVMLLGGEPIGPRHIWWNFVASSKERLEQAKANWQSGRIDPLKNERNTFFPLP